jgi:hypothetical protein
MMGACQPAIEPAPQPAAIGWSPVASWSGHANYQTDSFEIGSGQWRIKWQATAQQSSAPASFRVIVHSSVSGRFVSIAVDHPGAGSGIAYVTEDPREFFLVVESSGVDWKIAVEEGNVAQ